MIVPMATSSAGDVGMVGPDPALGRARLAVQLSVAASMLGTIGLAGVGILLDPRPLWRVLGTVGVLAVAGTQAWALHVATDTAQTRTGAARFAAPAFAGAVLASLALVAPVGTGQGWETWGWLGAAVVGTVPFLTGRRAGLLVAVAATVVSAAVGVATGGSPLAYALLTAGVGASLAAIHGVPLVLWRLVVQARDGREAIARLAAAEERLRFARDVHDLLGHHLTVIALKAELAARLAPGDGDTAARHAEDARGLAASALAQMRQVVHGYRDVDLPAQLDAIARVLRSSGVRCTLHVDTSDNIADLPVTAAAALAATAREAGTNVLRHSRARWCTIDLVRRPHLVRMTITNDGAPADAAATAAGDQHSTGLRGLADRLAESGGTLTASTTGGTFTLDVAVRVDRAVANTS